MTKLRFLCFIILGALLLSSCKKDDNSAGDFIDSGKPIFDAYRDQDNIKHVMATCLSHDIFLDTVLITDAINIKYTRYFNGAHYKKNDTIELGNNFAESNGDWQFIFRGVKASTGNRFASFLEKNFN